MKVLFRDDSRLFGIIKNTLSTVTISNEDVDNIKHLDDAKPLYHYRDAYNVYPIYYEHVVKNYKTYIITKFDNIYYIVTNFNRDKDYTLTNLDLI